MLGSFLDNFGIIMESFWNHFGIILGSLGNHYGIIWGSFCDHLEVILQSFLNPSGIILALFSIFVHQPGPPTCPLGSHMAIDPNTDIGYGTTNTDAGVGIGMKRGDSEI